MLKKMLFFVFMFMLAVNLFAASIEEGLKTNLTENFKKRGIGDVELNVKKLKEIETLKGFYFFKVDIHDKAKNRNANQYIISDGNYIVPDLINIKDGSSFIKEYSFEYDVQQLDFSKLTFVKGDKNSKNIIVDASDFQCPFCRKAHSYLSDKLKNIKDYAVYMMHVPLSIHDKAVLYAKIFEAGAKLGKDFSDELYSGKYDKMKDEEIVSAFEKLSGNPAKFKEYLGSKEVEERVKNSESYASSLGINSTPVLFFNGKKVEGFNTQLIDKGLLSFK